MPWWCQIGSISAVRGPAQALSIGILHVTRANNSLDEIALKEVVEISPERRRVGAPSAHSVSVIGMSSGSTGTPKLVLITHANLFAVAATMQARFGLSENDRCVCVLPLYSGFALKIELVAPLLIGSSVALPKTQKPDDIAIWSSELNPTWFTATPTFLHAALDKLRATKDQKLVHSLRFFAASSAYLPEEVRTGLETSLGIPGLEYYGSREAEIIAANPAPPAKRKPGSAGLIFPDEVAILDDNGEILPGGSTGAIAVCGQGISPGYLEALPTGRNSIDVSHQFLEVAVDWRSRRYRRRWISLGRRSKQGDDQSGWRKNLAIRNRKSFTLASICQRSCSIFGSASSAGREHSRGSQS